MNIFAQWRLTCSKVGLAVRERLLYSPWTNTIGLARSILAFATALTLGANPTWALFRPGAGEPGNVGCAALAGHLSLFCLVPPVGVGFAQIFAVLILLVVASGWRPRYTALPHWWISYSFFASGRVTDGGEQVAAIITLLLLPLGLTDSRKWHWQSVSRHGPVRPNHNASRMIAYASAYIIQIQVGIIYIDACIEKLHDPQWLNGTIMYYVLTNNVFGVTHFVMSLMWPLIASPLIVFLAWPSLALEFFLGINIFLHKRARYALFWGLVTFHLMIAFFIGIPTFAMIMIAAGLLGVIPVGTNLADFLPTRSFGAREQRIQLGFVENLE